CTPRRRKANHPCWPSSERLLESENGVDRCIKEILFRRKNSGLMSLMWTALAMGLMGGFHCIGMCGPIALALPKSEGSSMSYTAGRILYNMGRVVTYALLGAAVGLFGLSLNLAGWQQSLSIFSGVLILLFQFAPGN